MQPILVQEVKDDHFIAKTSSVRLSDETSGVAQQSRRRSSYHRSRSTPPPSPARARISGQMHSSDELRLRLAARMAECESFRSLTVTVGTWPLFGVQPDGYSSAASRRTSRSESMPLLPSMRTSSWAPDPAGDVIRADHVLAWLGKVSLPSAHPARHLAIFSTCHVTTRPTILVSASVISSSVASCVRQAAGTDRKLDLPGPGTSG